MWGFTCGDSLMAQVRCRAYVPRGIPLFADDRTAGLLGQAIWARCLKGCPRVPRARRRRDRPQAWRPDGGFSGAENSWHGARWALVFPGIGRWHAISIVPTHNFLFWHGVCHVRRNLGFWHGLPRGSRSRTWCSSAAAVGPGMAKGRRKMNGEIWSICSVGLRGLLTVLAPESATKAAARTQL